MPAPEGVVRHSLTGVTEDHALQFLGDAPVLSGRPQQLGHEPQIDPAPLPDGDRQRLAGRVHAGDVPLRADGPLGEHIRLALQPPVLVNILKGA